MNNFWIILKKELVDIFRDKKTIVFTILLPIIMYPAMFKIMDLTLKNTTESVQKNITVAYRGEKNSSVYKMLKSVKNITIDNSGNAQEKLKKGDISLIIDVPGNFDSKVTAESKTNVRVIYDQDSNKSSMASSTMKDIFDKYSKSIVNGRLQAKGIDSQVLTPFDIKEEALSKDNSSPIAFGILSVLPTLLIIFMISPTIGIAADLV
ncbi:MAG TPA: ABC transporter permease, partial [Clostridium sp.]|nr:ABC transporter permease [Clostridium sp.]